MKTYPQRFFPPEGSTPVIWGYGISNHAPWPMKLWVIEQKEAGKLVGDYTRCVVERSDPRRPFTKRFTAWALWKEMRPGDHLVITSLAEVMYRREEWDELDMLLQENGIHLHVINFGGLSIDCLNPEDRKLMHAYWAFEDHEREVRCINAGKAVFAKERTYAKYIKRLRGERIRKRHLTRNRYQTKKKEPENGTPNVQ